MFNLTKYAVDYIKKDPNFELICEPHSVNVCFRYINKNKNICQNILTQNIRRILHTRGKFMISYQPMTDLPNFFRLAINSLDLTVETIKELFEEIKKTGSMLLA